ncbi:MAG: multi-sensor hybrid histidine kinase [Rhodospirillales bacterium]|nr:multi-sensor hybrid histidine kinase [Rhodospirillales bacterium]
MGDRIWVTSEVDRPVSAPVGTDPEAPLRPLRILMAEDSPDNCTIALAYLDDTPYQIGVAETGSSPARCSRPAPTILS